jgi:hypothetical protein
VSDYQCLVRFLLSPQAGCLVEVIDTILRRVHVYTRVNDFQEKAECFLMDEGQDAVDDDAAESIEQVRRMESGLVYFYYLLAFFFRLFMSFFAFLSIFLYRLTL